MSRGFGWALVLGFALAGSASAGENSKAASFTVSDYDAALPYWGTSWLAGPSAPNGYYPSFYTGFAPRSSAPSRLHIRLARGNQTRISLILDDETVRDYLFDLVKRYEFYHLATSGARPLVNPHPDETATKTRVIPQLDYFNRILESDVYGILPFVAQAQSGNVGTEALYAKSLATMKALNPGRVFDLRIDLTASFRAWRESVTALLAGADPAATLTLASPKTVIALDSLVPGRVNVTERPTAELLSKLVSTAQLAVAGGSDDELVRAAYDLFLSATGKKYAFRMLTSAGAWAKASACAGAGNCFLTYPEFTAIYPTGSIMQTTRDELGNVINDFATPGLWNFVSRGAAPFDNIREEPYYGWIPKMDYEAAGNGFHNPGVRFWEPSKQVKELLGIPLAHDTFWSVKRGGVSHGCSRLPSGHAWEMRHILPSTDSLATQVNYFGNDPRDFDLYDIDGSGTQRVMGVEYLISYNLRGTDSVGQREGTGIEIGSEHKAAFYSTLYGPTGVFRQASDGTFWFQSPTVSLPSYLDKKDKRIDARVKMAGEYPLYEQAYERDKIQLYLPITTAGLTDKGQAPLSKRIVRLMGRVRGCAPDANKELCGEAAFDREAKAIFAEAGLGLGQ